MTVRGRLAGAVLASVVTTACVQPVVATVADGTYRARVPAEEQWDTAAAADLPGGFMALRESGVGAIELSILGEAVTVAVDGEVVASRTVVERPVVTDREGSGPFRAQKEVLVLDGPLDLGSLSMRDPAIWPGGFEGNPVVTVKPFNADDRGPAVSCDAREPCVLLTSGVDPVGVYEDANDPELDQNPIAAVEVSEDLVTYTLDSGEVVESSRSAGTTTPACGLAETDLWDVPRTVGLDIDDPVLAHAACPTAPGDRYLVIMDRDDVPLLAPLGPEHGGEWCRPARDCLLFVPTF